MVKFTQDVVFLDLQRLYMRIIIAKTSFFLLLRLLE